MTHDRHTQDGPRRLTILKLPAVSYFVDLRLGQFRDVQDPGDCIDFSSEEGRQLCRQANIVTCGRCGAHVIVSSRLRADELNCVRCMAPIEPQR